MDISFTEKSPVKDTGCWSLNKLATQSVTVSGPVRAVWSLSQFINYLIIFFTPLAADYVWPPQ